MAPRQKKADTKASAAKADTKAPAAEETKETKDTKAQEAKTQETKAPETKAPAAEEKKAPAKKPARKAAPARAKKTEPVVILQYDNNDYPVADIQAKAEAAFKEENGRKAISEMNLYIKPEEGKAYYVVKSGKTEIPGEVDL